MLRSASHVKSNWIRLGDFAQIAIAWPLFETTTRRLLDKGAFAGCVESPSHRLHVVTAWKMSGFARQKHVLHCELTTLVRH
ncbi:hypothetical protein AXG89_28795 (plasmid) [Burkholderia sp. PAMC 26561]|nr:hypothetical protein AXG89_23895 [Burkholderia sp. PAMC 26561]AME27850.1 hypothetical protein AXG89_28795 [Burkholderia sp. PAMC 26561]